MAKLKVPDGPLSLRGFARAAGCSDFVVRKAVASGRIPAACMGTDPTGRPVIVDGKKAWRAFQRTATRAKPGGTATQALADVQRQVATQRARRLEFDNDLRAGVYVLVREAKLEAFNASRVIREGLLNLPSRLAAELAAEPDPQKVHARLDAEIRAVLGAVADALEQAS